MAPFPLVDTSKQSKSFAMSLFKKARKLSWWRGNARLLILSQIHFVAHCEPSALIILAGVFTLFKLSFYSADSPLVRIKGLILPTFHLATMGWGIGSADPGNTFP